MKEDLTTVPIPSQGVNAMKDTIVKRQDSHRLE